MANIAELNISIGADLREIKYALAELKGNIKSVKKDVDGLGKVFDDIKGRILQAVSVGGVIALGSSIIKTTAEFEKFEAVLTNTLGSKSAAQRSLAQIQEFAAKTPFSVKELTEAYVQLSNRGINPSTQTLTRLGDVAAALGKPLSQVNEAILDVTNSERWNELGIKVKVNGDKISGTFRGMTVESEKSEKGALKLIEAFGKMDGVAGGMAAISDTLGGKISNLGDAWDKFTNTLGQSTGIFKSTIGFLGDLLNGVSDLIAGTEAVAKRELASQFQRFFDESKKGFEEVSESAKQSGKDTSEAVEQQFKTKLSELESYLDEAKRDLAKFDKENNIGMLGGVFDTNAQEEKRKGLVELVVLFKGYIDALTDAKRESEKLVVTQKVEIGLIEAETKKLKELEEARDKAGTPKEVAKYNGLIATQSEYLKNLKEITLEEYKLSQIRLQSLTPKGFDTTPLKPESKGLGFSIELDTIKQVAAAMAIATNKSKVFGESFDLAAEQSGILNDALNYLVENGVSVNSFAIDSLKAQLHSLGEVSINVSGLITQTLTDALISVGEGIGQLMAGTQTVSGFFDGILLVVIDFVSSFGKLLISAGIASQAFKEALISNPYVAIAAGVALVAAAALVKGVLKKGPKAPALAQGGLAFGPTMALVGDNRNARVNPEVIAPLDRLKELMGANGGAMEVTGEFRLRGSDLVATVEKQNNRERRVF